MNVTIAAAQYPITAHVDLAAWKTHTEQWVQQAVNKQATLLLFPEYGAMELVSILPKEIQNDIRAQIIALDSLKEDFCLFFADLTKRYQVVIVAPSIPVVEDDKHYNRVFVFSEKGLVGYQDKFFMTRFENEEWGIHTAPKQLTLFEAEWGSFGIQICYDVEFALGSQYLCQAGASLILAPSCTETIRGATRVHVGARARALENQAYVCVSQTVGNAEWSPAVDINYGFAGCYSTADNGFPAEGIIELMPAQEIGWLVVTLDIALIQEVRNNGQVFNYQDHQQVHSGLVSEIIELQKVRV